MKHKLNFHFPDLLCPRRSDAAAEKMSELRLLAAFTRQLDNAMTVNSEADLAVIATTSKSQVGGVIMFRIWCQVTQ